MICVCAHRSVYTGVYSHTHGYMKVREQPWVESSGPVYFFVLFIYERRSYYVALTAYELRDPLASASKVLGLKVCHHAKLIWYRRIVYILSIIF